MGTFSLSSTGLGESRREIRVCSKGVSLDGTKHGVFLMFSQIYLQGAWVTVPVIHKEGKQKPEDVNPITTKLNQQIKTEGREGRFLGLCIPFFFFLLSSLAHLEPLPWRYRTHSLSITRLEKVENVK